MTTQIQTPTTTSNALHNRLYLFRRYQSFRRISRLAIFRLLLWRCHVLATAAMGYAAKLHYACRYFFLLIDRLKSLRLVKVECSFVCCDGIHLRIVYTRSLPPRSKLRHTVHLRIRSPITLRVFMKPSTLAACTANEVLRRQPRTHFEGALEPQFNLNNRATLMSMFFGDDPIHTSNLEQQEPTMALHVDSPDLLNRQDGGDEDAVSSRGHILSSSTYCFMFNLQYTLSYNYVHQ